MFVNVIIELPAAFYISHFRLAYADAHLEVAQTFWDNGCFKDKGILPYTSKSIYDGLASEFSG